MSAYPTFVVAAAGVGLLGQTISSIGAWFNSRAAKASASKAQASAADTHILLQGNGRGTVPAMLESLLEWQESHDIKHARIEARDRASARQRKEPSLASVK